MIDSKYVTLLKLFSKQELSEFEKWLNSPWCTTNKSLLPFFKIIKKHHPNFLFRESDEEIYLKAFPKKFFNYNIFRNLLSHSYQSAEEFLAHQHLKNKKLTKQKFLSKEYETRKQDESVFKILKKEINSLENKKPKDWDDHFSLFQFNKQAYHSPSPNSTIPDSKSIVKMDEHLNAIFVLEKAQIIKEKIFRNRILKNENHELEREIKNWLAIAEVTNMPSVELYKIRFKSYDANSKQRFIKLESEFKKRFESLNPKEQQEHLFMLLNDLVFLRRKKNATIEELLDLYKFGLETDAIFINGFLTPTTYTTVVSYSNILKDFDYTHLFIDDYTKFLNPKYQEDAKIWATSRTEYEKRNLNKSLDILLSHNFQTSYYQNNVKLLNFQIYFDLCLIDRSYLDYFINYSKNYERWVDRKKSISKVRKEATKTLIKKGRELVKYFYSSELFQEMAVASILDDVVHSDAPAWIASKRDLIISIKKKQKENG